MYVPAKKQNLTEFDYNQVKEVEKELKLKLFNSQSSKNDGKGRSLKLNTPNPVAKKSKKTRRGQRLWMS